MGIARDVLPAARLAAAAPLPDGGAIIAIAEMALAGGIGVQVTLPNVPNPAAILFGEDQGRVLVTAADPDPVIAAATAANIFAAPIGRTGGNAVSGPGFSAGLADLRAAHEGFFPKLMGNELTPEF